MTSNNHNEIAAYESQARECLAKSRKFLSNGDLRQAAEKGWDAAEQMAKAVALAQGWRYTRHGHFHRIMNQAGEATGNTPLAIPARPGRNPAHQLLRSQSRIGSLGSQPRH